MTFLETATQRSAAFKKCPAPGTMNALSALLEAFVLLNKDEQIIVSDELFAWAERHADRQPLKFASAQLCRSLALMFNEKYGPSLDLAMSAQRSFEGAGETRGAALCPVLIGTAYRAFGNVDLALKSFWEAYRELLKTELFAHFRMVSAYHIAGIYLELKNHAEAIPLFRSTYDLAVKEGDQRLRTYSLQGLGKTHALKQEFDQAEMYLDQAVTSADETGHPGIISGAITALAELQGSRGDHAVAERLHLQALAIREEHRFIGGAVTSCICLGRVYIQLGRTDEAIAILGKGLALAEPCGLKPKIWQIHLLLSQIHQGRGDLEKGLFHYQRFHDIQTEVEVEDADQKVKNLHTVFEAEQTRKENVIIKRQKAEIEAKNIELLNTIDELTRTRIGKKARAVTLAIAVVLFVIEDFFLGAVLHLLPKDNFLLSLLVKMVIIFSLSPINSAVERYLLKRVIRKKPAVREVGVSEEGAVGMILQPAA